MKRIVFPILMFLGVLAAENVWAQNSVNGVVLDNNRKPVAKIDVELLDEFERLIKTTKTSTSGVYFFQGLRSGVFFVKIRVDGTNFKPVMERIQIGQGNRTSRTSGAVSGAEILQVDFILEVERRNENPNPPINEVIFVQDVPRDAEISYENALKQLKANRPEDAIAELENAVRLFPTYLLALEKLGYEYIAADRFTEAEGVFTKALEVNPKSFSATSGLGISQFKLGKKSEAAITVEEATALNPSSAITFLFLGQIYRGLREFEKAETALKKAKKLSRDKFPDVHWELALLYYHDLNRYGEAADELELYLRAKPDAENKKQVEKLIKIFRDKAKQLKTR